MINDNINFISIKEVLSRVTNHPLLSDLNIEKAVRYTLDFIGIFGFNKMYSDKEVILNIKDFRTVLPCDLIRITQIQDCDTSINFRSMSESFTPIKDQQGEFTFKVQGNILYTSCKERKIKMTYKSIPVDEYGFPKIIDNPLYLKTLELYIKKQEFIILFDLGKINQTVLSHTETEYAWSAGQLQSEFIIPSIQEMETIKNMWTSVLQHNNSFYRDFKYGDSNNQLKIQ